MRGTIWRLFLVLGILAVLFATALVVAMPTERIGQVASARLEAATGRRLSLSGGFKPSLWPDLGITTGPLTISNADWAQAPELLRANGATIAVSPLALLSGRIEIRRLGFDAPQIELEIAQDGRANWQFTQPQSDPAGDAGGRGAGQQLARLSADITNGAIRLTDHRSGRRDLLDQVDVELSYDADARQAAVEGAGRYNATGIQFSAGMSSDRPLQQLSNLDITVEMTSDIGDVSLHGQLNDLSALTGDASFETEIPSLPDAIAALGLAPLPAGTGIVEDMRLEGTFGLQEGTAFVEATARADRDDVRVDLDLNADGPIGAPMNVVVFATAQDHLSVNFAGTLDPAGQAGGRIGLQADDVPRLIDWLGVGALELPPIAQRSLELNGTLQLAQDEVHLDDFTLTLADLAVAGTAAVRIAQRPDITAHLTMGDVVLADFLIAQHGAGAAAPQSGGQDQSDLPWQLLNTADLDLSLGLASLDADPLMLGASDVAIRVQDGQGQIRLNRVEGFGGNLSGDVQLDAGRQMLGAQFAMSGIRIEQVLAVTTQTDRLEGAGGLGADIRSGGPNIAAVIAALDGTIRVDLADGALRGVNLAEIGRNLTGAVQQDARTDFTEAHAAFDIVDGVMQVQELSALSPLLRLTGQGTIALPARRLDLKLIPRITADLVGQGGSHDSAGIAIPVEISGPWSNLTYRPDLGAYEDALRAQADEAVERFRNDLTAGEDPAGAARGALGDLEDAIRGEGGGLDVLRGLFK